jgi:hypothetical protein
LKEAVFGCWITKRADFEALFRSAFLEEGITLSEALEDRDALIEEAFVTNVKEVSPFKAIDVFFVYVCVSAVSVPI